MRNNTKILGFSILSVLLLFFSNACTSETESVKWLKTEKEIEKWETYNLQVKSLSASFPKRPQSKTIAYNEEISIHENYAVKDSVTYAITIIEHKGLNDAMSWKNFLEKEVLAFKAIERKNIKVQGREAVFSKVREADLCSFTLNFIVDNKYIINVALRKKGEFTSEKLLLNFADKINLG